jgi:hypothetical protein
MTFGCITGSSSCAATDAALTCSDGYRSATGATRERQKRQKRQK